MTRYRNHAEEIADAMAEDHRRVVAEPEPPSWMRRAVWPGIALCALVLLGMGVRHG